MRRAGAVLCAAVLAAALAACGSDQHPLKTTAGSAHPSPSPAGPTASPSSSGPPGTLLRADVLITSPRTLPTDLVERVAALPKVQGVEPLSLGAMSVEGRTLSIAAVDPEGFRRFTPEQTWRSDEVWDRVAGGEVAVDPSIPRRVVDRADMLPMGDGADSDRVHVAAFAPLNNPLAARAAFSAVVDRDRGAALGLPEDNALLVSTGDWTPSAVKGDLERVLHGRASLTVLALEFRTNVQTAVLTGASVASAAGSFSYTDGPNGTIRPDPHWVASYIRTEQVPILGTVTCNKAVLPQLRAALNEIRARGLADRIHPDEYGGCYYPRYIGRDPANGLSLHSWGIAFDINVPENQRGTRGSMDPQIVQIFEDWGFAWGGTWSYTDPMHFEMSRVVRVG